MEEANDPNTPQARLRVLYENEPSSHVWLAQNPNTPLDLLGKLGKDYEVLLRLSADPNTVEGSFAQQKLSIRVHKKKQEILDK